MAVKNLKSPCALTPKGHHRWIFMETQRKKKFTGRHGLVYKEYSLYECKCGAKKLVRGGWSV